jgi:hypothetical protein
LSETIKDIDDIQDKLNKINGSEVDAVKQRWRSYFSKNQGFEIMCGISCIIFFIIFKHPVAFIYTSYILKYTVFNATLSFSFLFILRHVSAALGHHQVFCCQSCLTVIYI